MDVHLDTEKLCDYIRDKARILIRPTPFLPIVTAIRISESRVAQSMPYF